jgi:hypothetical protein
VQGGAARNPVDSPFVLEPFGGAEGEFLDPRRMLTQNVKDVALLGSLLGQRAETPITLPGAFVQPTRWYSGGGLPFPMGTTGQDPALFQPGVHQYRAGLQFPQPAFPGPDSQATLETGAGVGEDGIDYSLIPDYARQAGLPTDTDRWLFGARGSADVDQITDPSQFDPTWVTDPDTDRRRALGPFTREGLDANVPGWNQALGGEMGGYAPRRTPQPRLHEGMKDWRPPMAQPDWTTPEGWMGGTQESGPLPEVGGGVPRLMANLELLGVTADPTTGNLVNQGPDEIGNRALFAGQDNVRRRYPAGPQPGTGLDTPAWQQADMGDPLTVPAATARPGTGQWGLNARTLPFGSTQKKGLA